MNKTIINGAVIVVAGCILAATAWNFNAVASMPEKYVIKKDNSEEHKQINEKLDHITNILMRRDK